MNPLTEFLNAYAGNETIADRITNGTVLDMQEAYRSAYARIALEMAKGAKDPNFATFAKQTSIFKGISEEIDKFEVAEGAILHRAMLKISDYATSVAIKDIKRISTELRNPEAWHKAYNVKYVEAAFEDAYGHIAAQTDKMAVEARELLRNQATQVFRMAAVTGMSRKEAHKELKAKLNEVDPAFTFTDRAGRSWDTSKYLEMLTRTVMHNTLNQSYLDTLANEGQDLVKVSTHGAKDACRRWEGKVLSITGATPGYPSLAEVRATGEIFHPRCRHRMLAYHPDIDDIFKGLE